MALGEKITALRKQKGLSQEKLAEELNLTRQTISKWELNQSTPDIEYLIRLSEIFEVSTDFLLKGKDEENQTNNEKANAVTNHHFSSTSNKKDGFGWLFGLGLTFSSISFISLIAFIFFTLKNPVTVVIHEGSLTHRYEDLEGFLVHHGIEWFYHLLIGILIASLVITLFGIIGRIILSKSKQK